MINYLETAAGIGRELVDQTGGAEGTWDGDCIVGAPGGGHRVQRQHVGHDLYGGSAGIGLVLSYLAAATGDSDFAQVGVAAVQQSLQGGQQLAANGQLSLYSGAAGIALAAMQASAAVGQGQLSQQANELARAVANAASQGTMQDQDLIGGKAGIIIALLALNTLAPTEGLNDAAASLAGRLVEQSESGWWGRLVRDPNGQALCGLGHGASGIGWALIEAGQALDRLDLCNAGEELLQYEEGHYSPANSSWPDLRALEQDATAEPGWMDAWCHGAFGIGALRWHLWSSSRSPLHMARATAAHWAARRAVVQAAASRQIADMTLCHGLAGAAELMLVAYEATGLDEHLRAARRVGDLVLRLRERNDGRWTVGLPGGSDVPGLFLGKAGICALFLRLHDPAAMETPLLAGSRVLRVGMNQAETGQ